MLKCIIVGMLVVIVIAIITVVVIVVVIVIFLIIIVSHRQDSAFDCELMHSVTTIDVRGANKNAGWSVP